MFNKVIISGLAICVVVLGGYGFWLEKTNSSLETENKNKKDAIAAYEALLKIEPFEAVTRERKERTDEEIDDIINDDTSIVDSTYKL